MDAVTKIIFDLEPEESLREALDSFDNDYLVESFGLKVFNRGRGYFHDERVGWQESYRNYLRMRVDGREAYTVELSREDDQLFASCSCPYESPCKHIVAFLLHLRERAAVHIFQDFESEQENLDAFTTYLNRLGESELRELINRLAPQEFKDRIRLEAALPEVKNTYFERYVDHLYGVLRDDEMDPDSTDDELAEAFERLLPFFATHTEALLLVFENIARRTEEALENGHFYDGFDGLFYADSWMGYAVDFIFDAAEERREEVAESILNTYFTYSMAASFSFVEILIARGQTRQQLGEIKAVLLAPEFLNRFNKNDRFLILDAYATAESSNDQLAILESMDVEDYEVAYRIAKIYQENGQAEKVIAALDKALGNEEKEMIGWYSTTNLQECLVLRIQLAREVEGRVAEKDWLIRYLQCIKTGEAIVYAVNLRPSCREEFEAVARKVWAVSFADYLQAVGREAEVPVLFQDQEEDFAFSDYVFKFYQKYAEQFPQKTYRTALDYTDKHLQKAKQRSYEQVVLGLKLLKRVIPEPEFLVRVRRIAGVYQRRTNLIGLFRKEGWL